MKKIIIPILFLSIILLLSACETKNNAIDLANNQSKDDVDGSFEIQEVNPSDPVYKQTSNLLKEYVGSGQYTKLTTLSYNDDASNYHAGANTRQRRTYYDETANALLMGNYDGSFETINSGYAKVESDMWHYSHKNVANITTDNMFDVEEMNHDYTLYATGANEYFDVLSDLVDVTLEATNLSRWDLTDGVYTYTASTPATIYNSSNYMNGLLKAFQYFAAPMLLLNNNIKLLSVTIQEIQMNVGETPTNVLLIQLFDSNFNKISEAIIVKGLTRAVVTAI